MNLCYDFALPIAEYPLVAFDTETTGLDNVRERVVELGAARVENGTTVYFSSLIDPERHIPEEASRINNITDGMLKGKPKFHEVADSFLEFCDGAVLVAHNANFDVGFLGIELQACGKQMPKVLTLDSIKLAKKIHTGLTSYKLNSVYYRVNKKHRPEDEMHRAKDDSKACLDISVKMIKELEDGAQTPLNSVYKSFGSELQFGNFDKDLLSLRLDQVYLYDAMKFKFSEIRYLSGYAESSLYGRFYAMNTRRNGTKELVFSEAISYKLVCIPLDSIMSITETDPLAASVGR